MVFSKPFKKVKLRDFIVYYCPEFICKNKHTIKVSYKGEIIKDEMH